MTENQLDGKIIIVTGAAGGLGRAMVEALILNGARVAAVDLASDRLDALSALSGPGKVLPLAVDLKDANACTAIASLTIEALGGLHGLVNNAGIGLSSIRENYYVDNIKFWDVPEDRWQAIFDVNVRAPFLISKSAIPHFMKQGWGRIVNVTTSMDTMIRRGWTPYGPSKGALEAQSACWSKDCEGSGISVNVLVPGGPANTAMVPESSSPDREAMVQPEVMKAPIVWLMSDDSDGFNGNRLTGTGWDKNLSGQAAAKKAAAPAAWPGAGQQSVWPDLKPA
jgi:3-oxoacyl-[acyl-carrier protein] reductase